MPFSLFLAFKYLKPKRTATSLVTIISVIGVTLGVAILLIVMSVMTGFEEMWIEKVLSFKPHLTINRLTPDRTRMVAIDEPDMICDRLVDLEGVIAATPSIETEVLLGYGRRTKPAIVVGVDPKREEQTRMIASNIISGVFDIEDDGVVIGRDLARRLGATVGGTVLLYSPLNVIEADTIYLPEEGVVKGIFNMGHRDSDAKLILTSTGLARELVGLEQGAYSIHVNVDDPINPGIFRTRVRATRSTLSFNDLLFMERLVAELETDPDALSETLMQTTGHDLDYLVQTVKRALFSLPYQPMLGTTSMIPRQFADIAKEIASAYSSNLSYDQAGISNEVLYKALFDNADGTRSTPVDTDYDVATWQEADAVLFRALTHEKNMMFILLGAITIVAIFCVTNTLIVIIVQKTKEIGLLKALGFSSRQIMASFVWVGWIQCMAGTLFGIATGLLVLVNLGNIVNMLAGFGTEVFPKDIYGLEGLPWEFSYLDAALIAGSVMVFSTLAALLPAWWASRLQPAEALRHE